MQIKHKNQRPYQFQNMSPRFEHELNYQGKKHIQDNKKKNLLKKMNNISNGKNGFLSGNNFQAKQNSSEVILI